jgi:hypothetical protein
MTVPKRSVTFLLILLLACSVSLPKEKKIRGYLTSMQWYPRSPADLKQMLEVFFKNAALKPVPGRIVGLIGPHAGLAYSGQCAAWAYKQLEKLPGLDRVIMLGVAHRGGFYGAAVSDFDYDSTPLGTIPVDTEVTAQLAKEKLFTKNNSLCKGNTPWKLTCLFYNLSKKDWEITGTKSCRFFSVTWRKKIFPEWRVSSKNTSPRKPW